MPGREIGMERALLTVVLVAVAVAVALLLQRRRPAPPTQPTRNAPPSQLDRRDFEDPAREWLVAVFTSSTCDSCAGALAKARVLASDSVVVQDIPWQTRKDLHDRYNIDTVPLIAVAGRDGVVRTTFVGTPSATDLWAAVADARG